MSELVQLSQLVALTAGGAPPHEFCLLANGETASTKGTTRCSARHAALCLSADTMPADGLLPLDYDHGMVSFMGGEKKAAGWFKLTNRNGSLWATDVQYTPAAEKALREREYRYFSPALYRDEDGYVTRIVNVALCCLPATLKQQPLMASEHSTVAAVSRGLPACATLAEALDYQHRYAVTALTEHLPSTFAAGMQRQLELTRVKSQVPVEEERVLTPEEKEGARMLKIPEDRYLAMIRKYERGDTKTPPGGQS